jgi:hypothetical protein
VDDAFIVIVKEGPEAGHAWIVDPLYADAEFAVRRFSGTDQAGANDEDLVGRTCDTLAHYSLFDSENTLVFVDIEGTSYSNLNTFDRAHGHVSGINTADIPHRTKSDVPHLVLFDLMVHRYAMHACASLPEVNVLDCSIEGSYGLGDKGQAGITTFSQQHMCNSICARFGLEPLGLTGSGRASGIEGEPADNTAST